MFKLGFSRFKTRLTHWFSATAVVCSLVATPALAVKLPPPEIGAKGYLLLDLTTHQTLADFNSTERLEPASLTKLMTAYMVFHALKNKQITLEQQVPVSTHAWKAVGSRMFIEPNKPVTVDQLLHGMIIQSGNDASRALAELLAGDEANFANLMNQRGRQMGMTNTQFKNSTGLPDPEHFTTAKDLSILAKAIIRDFPEYYRLYSIKEYSYNGINQRNRNRLLWIDESVDGMKTGHTNSAGYCLVSSAMRELPNGVQRRLLSIVLGTTSPQNRTQESLKLLNYGFQTFETVKLYEAEQTVATSEVFKGDLEQLPLGFKEDLLVNVPRGMAEQLKATIERKNKLIAPVPPGTPLGTLRLTLGDEVVLEKPLLALAEVKEAGLFGRLIDSAKLWMAGNTENETVKE